MALIFDDKPAGYDDEQGIMKWFGSNDGEYIECRVAVTALTRYWGAEGISDAELRRAFTENRDEIEKIARSKYATGNVETEQDSPIQNRTVIVVDYTGS